MTSVRKGVFETNSSSSHCIAMTRKPVAIKDYYTLTSNGYIVVKAKCYYSEYSYDVYKTLEDKLSFLFALICTDMWVKNGYKGIVTKKEMLENKYIQEINKILKENIPNCKGFRFGKNSFRTKPSDYTQTNDVGAYEGAVDTHHFQEFNNIEEYFEGNRIHLKNFLLNPKQAIFMNIFYYYNGCE